MDFETVLGIILIIIFLIVVFVIFKIVFGSFNKVFNDFKKEIITYVESETTMPLFCKKIHKFAMYILKPYFIVTIVVTFLALKVRHIYEMIIPIKNILWGILIVYIAFLLVYILVIDGVMIAFRNYVKTVSEIYCEYTAGRVYIAFCKALEIIMAVLSSIVFVGPICYMLYNSFIK